MTSAPRASAVQRLDANTNRTVGSWNDEVLLVVWHGRPTVKGAQFAYDQIDAMAERRGQRVGILAIIEADAPEPEPSARAALAYLFASANLAFAAVVVEGAARLGEVTGTPFGMMAGGKFRAPVRCFSSTPGAAAWCGNVGPREHGNLFTAEELSAAVRGLREMAVPLRTWW